MRVLIVVSAAAVLAACGSQGPVYRGAPPPGMSHAQYAAQLTGKSTATRFTPGYQTVDRGDAAPDSGDGAGTPD